MLIYNNVQIVEGKVMINYKNFIWNLNISVIFLNCSGICSQKVHTQINFKKSMNSLCCIEGVE